MTDTVPVVRSKITNSEKILLGSSFYTKTLLISVKCSVQSYHIILGSRFIPHF